MTELLAKVFGIYMLCGGLGMVLNQGMAMRVLDEYEDNAMLAYLTGAIVLMAGSALVLTHNLWGNWKEILVTLCGWGAAIEGAILLIYAPALMKFAKMLVPSPKIIPIFGIGTMALGAALLFL
ncbi:MAG: hypothetical protein HKN36_00910 [Hellea sp.]|nr:hypothetical protein [Hellea sp.]